ncbi:hypothetical protein [Paenibacillus sp. CF384]|uniref:hypothetical protein n=1 Tax=Paenibacillus sp. CF384 TaxID=1884382 RepID=UPI0008974896|nr:hypothetical protein [Paenibacillus sp. CF384]SDX27957.1 hypothetical protein SAMN05518855_1011133 [Paenibacillus sp. CF384]
MKKSAKLAVFCSIIGAGIIVFSLVTNQVQGDSDSVTPGSVNDPVVTKSYIDKQVAALVKAELANQNGGMDDKKLQEMFDAFRAEMEQSGGSSKVEVVTVPVGKRLVAKDGTEFIVRAGKAMAYSADANGISDLTDGVDITNGKPVPNNHFILFPRGGRGVTAQVGQKAALTVLVRGAYEIQVQQ